MHKLCQIVLVIRCCKCEPHQMKYNVTLLSGKLNLYRHRMKGEEQNRHSRYMRRPNDVKDRTKFLYEVCIVSRGKYINLLLVV